MKTIRFNVDPSRNWGEIKNVTAKAADLYIYDEIGWFGVSAADFINEIKSLKVETINLFINSSRLRQSTCLSTPPAARFSTV